MKKILFSLLAALCLWPAAGARAQVTKADYARIDTIFNRSARIYNPAVVAHWIGDTHEFWYANHERAGDFYYIVNAKTGGRRAAFPQDKLAAALSRATSQEVDPMSLALTEVEFEDAGNVEFNFADSGWRYNIKKNLLTQKELKKSEREQWFWRNHFERDTARVTSPDGLWDAYARDNNIYLRDRRSGEEIALTTDGTRKQYYGSRVKWSPDSRKLAGVKIREAEPRKMALIESSPAGQVQPIVHWRDYPKPGDELDVNMPVLFDIASMAQIPLDTEAYANQYELEITAWHPSGKAFTFEFNQRGHQRFVVAEVDAQTGAIHHIIDERPETFFTHHARYRHDLKNGKEVVWISERDGWRHIYLFDRQTGDVIRQVTRGEWVVRDVDHVDEEGRVIYFKASGFNKGEDPYNIHYCRINFDGSGFADMTPENANHTVRFSKDRKYFVDVYSRPDLPWVSQIKRTSDASTVREIQRCDISDIVAEGWTMPEVFHTKGRDGKTDIWGNILRPTNFDPTKSYPVIELIYAGPHDSHVNKNFAPVNRMTDKLVNLGFIVVNIDGMGTFNRSKAFHDVCWKNLKDAGFPDRILWIKAAAEKYPAMDISKVGIFGRSAGGQNAMGALLFHNDFYKVAVALCGCHDNRVDKIGWNEQWMGYPVDESYAASSNVENAHLLKGKLLLMNGELDDNVDPVSSLQAANALIKAGKNFDQIYMPGGTHSLNGDFEWRRIHDFFVKHLLDQEPPEWE